MNKKLIIFLILFLFFIPISVYATDFDYEINLKKEFDYKNSDLNATVLWNEEGLALSEFYGKIKYNFGDITIGKKKVKQGPGYFSQLMLSDQGPPLKVIILENRFKWFDFKQQVAYLGEGVNKQLFVHRLTSDQIYPGLKLGISEAMMASEHIHPAYYIPFLPYYLIAKVIGLDSIYNSYEDKYIGLDFTYTFKNRSMVYGELLVDEYPQRPSNNNPDKRAHLIGFYYPFNQDTEVRAEYSNVFNYVYLHRYPQNNYTYKGQLIGHQLGPDADVFDIEVKRDLNQKETIRIGLRYLRKGIGNLSQDFQGDHSKRFLSTVTKRETLLKLEYNRRIKENIEMETWVNTGISRKAGGEKEKVFRFGYGVTIQL